MINWRDAATNPPKKEDADSDSGFVIVPDSSEPDGFGYHHYNNCKTGKWLTLAEFKAHIESTLNPPDSPWVYAKDRMPTKEDGDFVLWMCDEYQRPVVWRIERFGQSASTEKNNLRWCRIPPCPPPPKRELPAVAPELFPAFVTLRNGEHAIATRMCPGGQDMTILGCKAINGGFGSETHWWYVATGQAMTDKLSENDIVHVGGWLTKEELEAKRNGN